VYVNLGVDSLVDWLYNTNLHTQKGWLIMAYVITFVAGLIIGAAGLGFSDVARIADAGVSKAAIVVKETTK